jgi:hypothetical protein
MRAVAVLKSGLRERLTVGPFGPGAATHYVAKVRFIR